MPFKAEFKRFLEADPERLHFAAHSHHLWPDVTFAAQQQAWLDAASRVDTKWEHVFGELLPKAQDHIARALGLSNGRGIAFAPNTHELLGRLFSCLSRRPVRILTSDSEFHSFERQSRRWEEAGAAEVVRVPTAPFETFDERFLETVAKGGFDLVFVSQVFFNSGFVFERLDELVTALLDPKAFLVVDGYHGFMARPTDLSRLEGRAFYLSGSYKYAMAGEGVCFMHCPPGYGERPVNTGWMAGFGELETRRAKGTVGYGQGGSRFFGSTFDPTGFYRFNAVMDRWAELGVTVDDIHRHVVALQARFLDAVEAQRAGPLETRQLLPPPAMHERGHFLTFERQDAGELYQRLREQNVLTDYRDDRLRFGFGLYHDQGDVERLLDVLNGLD